MGQLSQICDMGTAHGYYRNFVSTQYLVNMLMEFDKILYVH